MLSARISHLSVLQAEAARLSSMLSMDSTLAGMPARGVGGN